MDISSEPTKITASDGEPWEQFGISFDISGDVVVVGAYDDDDGGTYAGSAYVYNLLDLSESPTKLVPSELDNYDDFGLYVATNGSLIAISARMDDDAGGNAGAVYVYDASNLSAQPTKLIPPSSSDGQYFGSDGLSIDDSSLVVGAVGSGTVYVYDVNDLSAQPATLTAFDGEAYDGFGKAVAMTSTKIFVGSLNDDDNGQDTGSVYIFNRSDLSAQATKLTAYDSAIQQRFGGTLSVSDNYLYVGAQGYLSNQGRVYAYALNNLSGQPTQLVAPDGEAADAFSIGLYASNGFLAVGAYLDDDPNHSGAVYVYDESDLSTQPTKLKPSDIGTSDHFGYAFAIGAASQYVPPPPPPATVADMTIDDWTIIGGNELIANPGGSQNTEMWWRRNEIVNYGHDSVAYYEISNMLPGESYELTFEVKLASGSGYTGVEVHETADASSLITSTYTSGGYQSRTLSWTQPAGLTVAYMHLVSQNSGGIGEMRDAVLTKVS